MFAKLKGLVDTIGDDHVMIDVSGVVYLCFASAATLRTLPSEGEATTIFIETHVREDHIHLYGFATQDEKTWFNTLTSVSGVGTKMGLAILSTLTADQITAALMSEDKPALTQVSGVGPKLAARIITELKDKIPQSMDVSLPTQTSGTTGAIPAVPANSTVMNDAVVALTQLGYSRSEAYSTVSGLIAKDHDLSVEDAIRLGLQTLARVA